MTLPYSLMVLWQGNRHEILVTRYADINAAIEYASILSRAPNVKSVRVCTLSNTVAMFSA